MKDDSQFRETEKVMFCAQCNKPVVQSEIDKNSGKCPHCNKEFNDRDS